MIYKAFYSMTYDLLLLPETGMGYQIIDAKRKGQYTKDRFIVYNSELIVDFDDKFSESKRQILSEGHSKIMSKVDYLSLENATIVKKHVLKETRFLSESKKKEKGRHSGGRGAIDNPKENADGKELFVRLSAYENDRRIDFTNKKLKPGTYTTTNSDYSICIRLVDDPIDRYALPNDEEIKWAFYVQPKTNDSLQRGIVQPAFGHDGGGIEVYFESGTSNNTYLDKRPYGK